MIPNGQPILRPVSTWDDARRSLLSCATARALAGALLCLQEACCDVWQDLWSQCCDGSCVLSRSVLPQQCHRCRETTSVSVHQCASVPLWRPGYGSYGDSCSGYSGGSQVCVGASNNAAGAAVHALRRPLGALHGVAGAACRPRRRRSVQRGLRRRDGQVDRMVGVLGMARRSGRCYLEGYAGLQMMVY